MLATLQASGCSKADASPDTKLLRLRAVRRACEACRASRRCRPRRTRCGASLKRSPGRSVESATTGSLRKREGVETACHVSSDSETPRLETAKGCHKVIDLAGRRCLTGFEVALNA